MLKIRAFTILEMLINLAIMAIIISMVYFVYIYFSKNMADYSEIVSGNFEVQSFYGGLKEDFFLSDKVTVENGRDFTIHFYDGRKVAYYQKSGFLIRDNTVGKDSIQLVGLKIDFLHTPRGIKSKELVRSVTLTTNLLEKNINLFVYKTYFSNYLQEE